MRDCGFTRSRNGQSFSKCVRSEGSKVRPVKDRARNHSIREMRAQRRNKKEIDRARKHT